MAISAVMADIGDTQYEQFYELSNRFFYTDLTLSVLPRHLDWFDRGHVHFVHATSSGFGHVSFALNKQVEAGLFLPGSPQSCACL